jgi:hypothetical protein
MEKGVVISFLPPGEEKLKYEYSKLNPTLEEVAEWRAEREAAHPDWSVVEFRYWILTQVSCIPIFRDHTWFDGTALPKLACAWNGVRYWRAKEESLEETGPVVFLEENLQQMNMEMTGPSTGEVPKKTRVITRKPKPAPAAEPAPCPYTLDDL